MVQQVSSEWMPETQKATARIAGVCFSLWFLFAAVRLFFVPISVLMAGPASDLSRRVLEHESLFRVSMVTDLAAGFARLLMALALSRLLMHAGRSRATLIATVGGVIVMALYVVNVSNDFAALLVARGDGILNSLQQDERNALMALFLRIHEQVLHANMVCWGLWLLPFASLIDRSKLMPRVVAALLAANGTAWIIAGASSFLTSRYEAIGMAMFPAYMVEVVVMFWLLIFGLRNKPLGSVIEHDLTHGEGS